MVARAGRAGAPADRVPRRAGVAVRRPRAAGRLPARPRARRASRSTSGWSSGPAFDAAGGALGVDALLGRRRAVHGDRCANDLLALGALQRLAELGHRRPGRGVASPGFDDISTAAHHGAQPVHRAAAAARARPARVRARGPRPATATTPAPGAAADRGGPARRRRGRPPAGQAGLDRRRVDRRPPAPVLMGDALRGRVVLVTGSSRGIGAEVAVKAAAEGATVAVHYHRGAGRRPQRTLARAREARRRGRGVRRRHPRRRRGRGARRPASSSASAASTASSTTPAGRWSGRSSRPAPRTGRTSSRTDLTGRVPHLPGRAAVDDRARRRRPS